MVIRPGAKMSAYAKQFSDFLIINGRFKVILSLF